MANLVYMKTNKQTDKKLDGVRNRKIQGERGGEGEGRA